MSDIQELTQKILKFREERNWKQFHNPKDIALSLSLEAAEVLEHFQWKNGAELEEYSKKAKNEIGKELADVLNWVLLLSHDLNIDIKKVFLQKIKENAKKYPVKKSMNSSAKYTQI